MPQKEIKVDILSSVSHLDDTIVATVPTLTTLSFNNLLTKREIKIKKHAALVSNIIDMLNDLTTHNEFKAQNIKCLMIVYGLGRNGKSVFVTQLQGEYNNKIDNINDKDFSLAYKKTENFIWSLARKQEYMSEELAPIMHFDFTTQGLKKLENILIKPEIQRDLEIIIEKEQLQKSISSSLGNTGATLQKEKFKI